jgi:hypothetical protein
MNMGEESFPLGKCRVLCISPDDDMGFLINLPAPCNLLYQPLPEDGKFVFLLLINNNPWGGGGEVGTGTPQAADLRALVEFFFTKNIFF